MKTRFTELVGIRYPIVQGAMQWLGEPGLAAAVSNAGGLGTLNVTIYPDPEELRTAIRRTKALTSMPFCVNITMLPEVTDFTQIKNYIRVCAEEQVRIIETAGMSPEAFVPQIKEAGLLLMHKVPAVKHALTAERIGADAVVIVGFEAGGHPGRDEVVGSVMVNRAADLLKIPVLMAGGIANGKGLAAALALGAEGVTMGTRFVASKECRISQNHKAWVVEHTENDTVICQKSIKNPARVANNDQAKKVLELEARGTTLEELMPYISGKVGLSTYISGDPEGAMFALGHSMGLVHEVLSCQEIIDATIREAEATLARMNKQFQ